MAVRREGRDCRPAAVEARLVRRAVYQGAAALRRRRRRG